MSGDDILVKMRINLALESKSLNMVISADMSVCGVSAAIATAASCKAKKEELSFAEGNLICPQHGTGQRNKLARE